METLVLDGRRYVKASKAASNLGYTSDYIGQLCRSGQVKAHLVGRTWYVDEEELSTHRVEKKRMSRVKAREYAKKALAEYRANPRSQSQKSYEKVAIRYETDNESLIPEPKKLVVASDDTVTRARERSRVLQKPAAEPSYEVENPGEKIVMSGKLDVVDLNDEDAIPDKHTVFLKARVNRKMPSQKTMARSSEPLVQPEATDVSDESEDATQDSSVSAPVAQRLSFAERLMVNADTVSKTDVPAGASLPVASDTAQPDAPISFLPTIASTDTGVRPIGLISPIFGLLLPLVLSLGSLFIEQVITYGAGVQGSGMYAKEYTVDAATVISELRSKI